MANELEEHIRAVIAEQLGIEENINFVPGYRGIPVRVTQGRDVTVRWAGSRSDRRLRERRGGL